MCCLVEAEAGAAVGLLVRGEHGPSFAWQSWAQLQRHLTQAARLVRCWVEASVAPALLDRGRCGPSFAGQRWVRLQSADKGAALELGRGKGPSIALQRRAQRKRYLAETGQL